MAKKRILLLNCDQLLVEGYNNGATLRQLADFHKVSAGTIRAILKSNNVNMRSVGRKKEK